MTTPDASAAQIAAYSPTYDAVDEAKSRMSATIANVAGNWTGGEVTQGMDSTARHMLSGASQAVIKAVSAIEGSRAEARAWQANLDIAADGREARSKAALDAGKAAAAEALAQAQDLADVGEALLVRASSPSFGENFRDANAATAQAERRFKMALDSAPDNGELVQRLSALAGSDGHLSALATDADFLDLYLMGRGINTQERSEIANVVRERALQARASRGEPNAKLALAIRKTLRGTIGATKSLAQHR